MYCYKRDFRNLPILTLLQLLSFSLFIMAPEGGHIGFDLTIFIVFGLS